MATLGGTDVEFKMVWRGWMSLGLVTLLGIPGDAMATDNAAPVHFVSHDAQFARDAAQFLSAQIHGSKLAVRQAAQPPLRRLAQRIINDDMAMVRHLRTIMEARAEAYGQPLPLPEQQALQNLRQSDAQSFDAAYHRWQLQALLHATDSFALHAQRAQDPILLQWARRALPVLRSQLSRAQGVQTTLAPDV